MFRYLGSIRLGSRRIRNTHSRHSFCIHMGARFTVPAVKSNAAPTPSISAFILWRCSYIHHSCFGAPSATQTKSAPLSLIRLTTSSSSACVSSLKGGEYMPAICSFGYRRSSAVRNASSVASVLP